MTQQFQMDTLSPLRSYLQLMRKEPHHEKTQLSKKSKPAYKNRVTPTRYERERAAMKNKPRKVLNLEERVLAIRLYHENPVYQRVASIFKCSWEQIRNVIANRDDILRYYGECQTVTSKDSPQYARNKKINFLGNVTYEFVKRAYYHQSAILNDDVIQQRATKIRDALNIAQFHPNRAWIADFKRVYNIDWDNLGALIISGAPPHSLDIKDLIDYCTRMVTKARALIGEVPKQQVRKEAKCNNDMQEYDDDDGDDDMDAYGDGAYGGDFSGAYGDNEFDSMQADNYDDVPVVNEIDDYAGMYLNNSGGGNGTEGMDQTLHEVEGESITPHNYVDTPRSSFNAAANSSAFRPIVQQETTPKSSTHLLGDVQIKEEQRSRSNSPALLASSLNMGSSTSANAVQSKKVDGSAATPAEAKTSSVPGASISSYAAAIRALSPLENFAMQHENFQAINLLTQLAHLFEKGAKRNPERRQI